MFRLKADMLNLEKIVEKYKIVTFDIFDTILLRNEDSEIEKFYFLMKLISEKYRIKKLSVLDLLLLRLNSNEIAYSHTEHQLGSREATISEILNIFSRSLLKYGIEIGSSELKNLELSYEASILNPCSEILGLIKDLNASGVKVILITDMYMQKNDLHDLFRNIKASSIDLLMGLEIYSSADYKFTKSNKMIFEHVLKQVKVKPEEVLHVGDSFYEIYNCISLGMGGYHIPVSPEKMELRVQSEEKIKGMIYA